MSTTPPPGAWGSEPPADEPPPSGGGSGWPEPGSSQGGWPSTPEPGTPPPGGYPPPGSYPPPGGGYPPPGAYPPPPGGGYPPPGAYPPPPAGGWRNPEPVGGELAGWWRRVGATIVDGLVLLVPAIILAVGRVFYVDWVLQGVYTILLLGQPRGQTVGNMAVTTRTVDVNTGGPIGYGKSAGRWVVSFLLGLTVIGGVLDVLWPLWDSRNQTLHDKAAGTVVIRTY